MATERTVEGGSTTVIKEGGGGAGGVIIGIALLALVAIIGFFAWSYMQNDNVKTSAVSSVAGSASQAADSVGQAADAVNPAK